MLQARCLPDFWCSGSVCKERRGNREQFTRCALFGMHETMVTRGCWWKTVSTESSAWEKLLRPLGWKQHGESQWLFPGSFAFNIMPKHVHDSWESVTPTPVPSPSTPFLHAALMSRTPGQVVPALPWSLHTGGDGRICSQEKGTN